MVKISSEGLNKYGASLSTYERGGERPEDSEIDAGCCGLVAGLVGGVLSGEPAGAQVSEGDLRLPLSLPLSRSPSLSETPRGPICRRESLVQEIA